MNSLLRISNKKNKNALATTTPTMFDPEGVEYDYETAERFGLQPDETGHWPSRAPNGQLLKGAGHETYYKTLTGEKEAGYEIIKGEDGRYYSFPIQRRQWHE